VAESRFRPDLYYRLNVYTIMLPPLRARREDLPLLVGHFLRKANQELGKQVRGIAPEAMGRLHEYPWPGNVRELQSVLKRAVLQATGPVLLADFFSEMGASNAAPALELKAAMPSSATDWHTFVEDRIRAGTTRLYDEAIAMADREVITRVLWHTAGNQVQAARILGITRTTLRTKMRQLGITLGRVIHEENGSGEEPPENHDA